ncbi:MAG: BREX system P-loop protein BrxC, partial [Thermoanaerobaculia bacterium]
DAPPAGGTDVQVWVRDGWSVSEKTVLDSARSAGQDSPTVFVFVPKKGWDALRTAIIQAKAAQEVFDLKGVPATDAGREARSAMQTRCEHAEARRASLVHDLMDSARVLKGGGQELHNFTLEERVRDAVEAALDRLFPQFRQADHKNWPVVIGRARNGDDSPLEPLGWTGPSTEHPVCREILQFIGSGKDGRAVRRALSESPYGWPQDAIDGGLIALHAGGHLLATQSGTNLGAGQLDQTKIAKTEFRTESVTLNAQDKLHLRGLFQEAGLTVRTSDDLVAKSSEFLEKVGVLAANAGGPAPLPEPPNTKLHDELRSLAGNERLSRMIASRDVLKSAVKEARERSELAGRRLPTWERLSRLLKHGDTVAAMADVRSAADAIGDQRLLLDSTDRATPLAKQAATALRAALLEAHRVLAESHARHLESLVANDAWRRIGDADRQRILTEEGIDKVSSVQVASDEDLIAELDRTGLHSWKDRTDALDGRFANAATKAARLLEPKVQRMHLSSGTLKTEADVRVWLGEQEKSLLAQLQHGPIVIA